MDIYRTLRSAYTLSDGRTMRIDSFEGRALFDETTDLPQCGPGAARQAGKMVCVVACAQDAIGGGSCVVQARARAWVLFSTVTNQ